MTQIQNQQIHTGTDHSSFCTSRLPHPLACASQHPVSDFVLHHAKFLWIVGSILQSLRASCWQKHSGKCREPVAAHRSTGMEKCSSRTPEPVNSAPDLGLPAPRNSKTHQMFCEKWPYSLSFGWLVTSAWRTARAVVPKIDCCWFFCSFVDCNSLTSGWSQRWREKFKRYHNHVVLTFC